ncbi:hypothetical protein DXG01_000305 [Tephrocybe rancida]|nr:hypothetical protein DXG01_000305 [Tephrocybe rancida]
MTQEAPERWEGLSIQIHERDTNDAGSRGSRSSQFWANPDVDGSYTVRNSSEIRVHGRHLAFPIDHVQSLATALSALITPSIPNHRVAQYSPRYRLSFTLLNEDASAGNAFHDWDIATAISQHIKPVLTRLKALHNFTIESQVQLHAPLAFTPRPIDNIFGVAAEDLTVFVNSAEWTLCQCIFLLYQLVLTKASASSASNDPVLHFVIFVPSADRRPLHILDQTGAISPSTSFLLPQWGGIVILNPDESSPETRLALPALDTVFSAFSEHLLSLLGVPNLPPNVAQASSSLTDWQIDALLRYRTLSNSKGSQDTLRSIVSLVDQIENMPVGQDVRGDVQGALNALEEMFASSKASLVDTFHQSTRAFTLSSRAFFNPGMLALLYFPAEHKYAVYTPMFASAVIPLVVAALKELASWRRQRRTNTLKKNIPEGTVAVVQTT